MFEAFVLAGLVVWGDRLWLWASWKLKDSSYQKQGRKLALKRMGL